VTFEKIFFFDIAWKIIFRKIVDFTQQVV